MKDRRQLFVILPVCGVLIALLAGIWYGRFRLPAGGTDSPLTGPSEPYQPPEPAEVPADTLREITFRYQNGRDYSAVCYYSDAYFASSAYAYQQSLATMSLSLAMSAFGSAAGGYDTKSANVKDLLRSIGVPEEAIGVNAWFTVKPEVDSIGVAVGSKPIRAGEQDYTLIALAVRGGGYEREWGSNFTLGTEGQHQGFREARDNALGYLRTYIAWQGITGPVKFWITGFSRAAATANLISGALDDGVDLGDTVTYAPEDVYAYCFETPAGAVASEVRWHSLYYNIFNIINQSDPVPFVAPSALDFGRYGIDRYLPSAQSSSHYQEQRDRMLDFYAAMPSVGEYIVDNFQMQRITGLDHWLPDGQRPSLRIEPDPRNRYSQGVFLANYVTILARDFLGNRETYVDRYQREIREICSVFFGCTAAQSETLIDSLKGQVQREWKDLVIAYLWNTGFNPLGKEEDAFQLVSNWLNRAIQDAGITDYSPETIDSAGKRLSDLFLALIANHPNYFTTLLLNLEGVGAAHYPELCFAWMASMDANYAPENIVSLNSGSFRVVRVNSYADVRVLDQEGQVVAAIVDGEPQDLGTILSAVNEDGEKVIILPVDTSYSVEVTGGAVEPDAAGGEDMEVHYGIDEYSGLMGDITRSVDFTSIPVPEGGLLTGEVPAYTDAEIVEDTPEGSTAAYTLILSETPQEPEENGTVLEPDSELSGEAASEAWYQVTVSSNDESRGLALGGGLRQYGNFAQVEAAVREGCKLTGWFENGELVSEEEIYRFPVTRDVALEARFADGEPPSWPITLPEAGPTGRLLSTRTAARQGDYVILTLRPARDYEAVDLAVRDENGSALPLTFMGLRRYRFTMPAGPVTAEVSFRNWKYPFTDVPEGAYYYDAVYWAVENGVTRGMTETSFAPGLDCTRGQTVAFLWRAAGSPAPVTTENPFVDLSPEEYFYEAALWAAETGITTGTGPDTFSPYAPMTRGQAAAFLYRTAGGQPSGTVSPFADVPPDHPWYDAVNWAAASGITAGTAPDTFSPDLVCSRGQVVTFLYRFFQNP